MPTAPSLLAVSNELTRRPKPSSPEALSRLCLDMNIRGHLCVLREPYVTFILDGRKTIESRFHKTKKLPFQKVAAGDILFLKRSGGSLRGLVLIGHTEYHGPMRDGEAEALLRKHRAALAIGESFILEKKKSRYASRLSILDRTAADHIPCTNADGRAWVVLVHKQSART
jgi:hypothetical protein